jgi:hypothetical protein
MASSASSTAPDESAELVHDVLLRHEQNKIDLGCVDSLLANSPFAEAADQLSAVAHCLDIAARLKLPANRQDFSLTT